MNKSVYQDESSCLYRWKTLILLNVFSRDFNFVLERIMKKSIIALVIAGLPLAASAEVILYGQIKSSVTVGQVKIKGDAGSETSSTATSINDNTSRIGFKGSENLGGDLKAIWQVEQKTAITGGSQGFATRDSFIGLQGNFGKIRAGKLSNMLNEMDTIDPWMYKTNAAGLTEGNAHKSKFIKTARTKRRVKFCSLFKQIFIIRV